MHAILGRMLLRVPIKKKAPIQLLFLVSSRWESTRNSFNGSMRPHVMFTCVRKRKRALLQYLIYTRDETRPLLGTAFSSTVHNCTLEEKSSS